MINLVSPIMHNLGDFSHCLPVISGLHKVVGEKMHFIICDKLERFIGIKDLLMAQGMFSKISFVREVVDAEIRGILIDHTGVEEGCGIRPLASHKMYTFIRDTYNLKFEYDDNFEMIVPRLDIDYLENKFLVGDRWAATDAPDVDTRKGSNIIESSGVVDSNDVHYLDYSKDLMYNCSLIKYNPNPFITTITGVVILADMMNKEVVVLWNDEYKTSWPNISGETIEKIYDLHHFKNRKTKMIYINNFKL